MCFYRFTHITDDLQSVTSRILHSTADSRSIRLQLYDFLHTTGNFHFQKSVRIFKNLMTRF